MVSTKLLFLERIVIPLHRKVHGIADVPAELEVSLTILG